MFRLTPWSNDPVADTNTEVFYIRDEDTGSYCPRPVCHARAMRFTASDMASATASLRTAKAASTAN